MIWIIMVLFDSQAPLWRLEVFMYFFFEGTGVKKK